MSVRSSRNSSPEPMPDASAVIVAAGAGRRMGGAAGGSRKQYLEIAGEPVLLRALRPFLDHPRVGHVAVVLPPEDLAAPPAWLAELPVSRVAGGAERGDSVWNGLRAVEGRGALVLIHDGARPFVSADLIDRVLAAAVHGGAVAALPATDTLKEVDADGRVAATVDRSRFWHAQTPQAFRYDDIVAAHRAAREAGVAATDDAALAERHGVPVYVVEGDPANIKVTRPFDLEIAGILARGLRRPAG